MISGEFSVYVSQVYSGPPSTWMGVIEKRQGRRLWVGPSPEYVRSQVEQDFAGVVYPWKLGYFGRDGWMLGHPPAHFAEVRPC